MNSNSKLNGLLGMAAVVALLPCVATPVHADQINTPGTVCQQATPEAGKLLYLPNGGVRFVANPGFASTRLVCPIPRTPLGPAVGNRIFFIDGDNAGGSTTSCSIMVFSFNGVLQTSIFNSSALGMYHLPFSIPSASLSPLNYVTALCSLPNGGVLRGMMSKD